MNSELENKRLPFEVPENYFEDFAARMDARLAEEMQKTQPKVEVKGRKIDFRRLAALVASSAAVFAGLLFGGVALMNMQQQVDNQAAEIIAQETYVDEMLEMTENSRERNAIMSAIKIIENFYKIEKFGQIKYKVIEATLSYEPVYCHRCGCVFDKEQICFAFSFLLLSIILNTLDTLVFLSKKLPGNSI